MTCKSLACTFGWSVTQLRRASALGMLVTAVLSLPLHAADCSALPRSIELPADTTITAAEQLAAGPFTLPAAPGATSAPAVAQLPAFCRIRGNIAPAVQFEVWLPVAEWNGRLQGVGNGGTAGVISYPAMATALQRGYATASTDTGHVNQRSFDSSWALGHPELVDDFGHRGLHLTTVQAKAIVQAFYGRAPAHAYFVGCSKGGQQAMMEAQRYPDDYDGIVAGDPAQDWTRFYAGAHLWYALATLKDPASYIPADKIGLLGNAVTAACDTIDGIADGVLDDPRQCHFDPGVLQCPDMAEARVGVADAGDTAAARVRQCLTAPQVAAVRAIWSGARNAAGVQVYPGLLPGGEAGPAGWLPWTIGSGPFTGSHWLAAEGWFKNAVFANPDWDFRSFDYDADLALALQRSAHAVDANNPDLARFAARGGKLLAYHGYSDPDISPLGSIAYHEQVLAQLVDDGDRAAAATRAATFYRLFMVPGMAHCSGGPGPDSFDALTALEDWVERGVAPTRILASLRRDGVVVRTRPLCPYPQVAQFSGSGSTDDAANFACALPTQVSATRDPAAPSPASTQD